MSARLFQRVLKEREPDISAPASAASEEESDSPPSTVPARNPFDLLDDQACVFFLYFLVMSHLSPREPRVQLHSNPTNLVNIQLA